MLPRFCEKCSHYELSGLLRNIPQGNLKGFFNNPYESFDPP
jgi:hypothetical protein